MIYLAEYGTKKIEIECSSEKTAEIAIRSRFGLHKSVKIVIRVADKDESYSYSNNSLKPSKHF